MAVFDPGIKQTTNTVQGEQGSFNTLPNYSSNYKQRAYIIVINTCICSLYNLLMNNVDWKELDELVGIPTAKIYANFTEGVVVGDILGTKYLHMLLHLTHDIKSSLEVIFNII